MQRKFIKEHLHIFEDEGATNQQQQVFSRYQQEVETYLTQVQNIGNLAPYHTHPRLQYEKIYGAADNKAGTN